MAALIGLEFLLRHMGLQAYLPLRLLIFVVLGCSTSIFTFLWQIRRVRKKDIDSHVVGTKATFPIDLVKILGGYGLIEAGVFGIVFVTTDFSVKHMLWTYFLFLVPALLGVPPICHARTLIRHPKAPALWFAIAMLLFVPSIVVATVFSGLDKWLGVPVSRGGGIFVTVFGTAIASAYYSAYKSLSQRRAANQEPTQ
jgi:hypothetical protein